MTINIGFPSLSAAWSLQLGNQQPYVAKQVGIAVAASSRVQMGPMAIKVFARTYGLTFVDTHSERPERAIESCAYIRSIA